MVCVTLERMFGDMWHWHSTQRSQMQTKSVCRAIKGLAQGHVQESQDARNAENMQGKVYLLENKQMAKCNVLNHVNSNRSSFLLFVFPASIKCQVTCGRGAKLRSVTCVNEMGLIVNDDQCYEPKPAIYEICDMGSCAKIWFYTDWSSTCNMYCESERLIKRRIVCGADATSANASMVLANQSRNCDQSKIPEPGKKCTASISCIGSWFAGTWSEVRDNQTTV
jgi:hypothetical protein